jgi:GGDEF domain-containing protein
VRGAGPVRHVVDLAGDRPLALFARAASRDFVDVSVLLERFSREEMLRFGRPRIEDSRLRSSPTRSASFRRMTQSMSSDDLLVRVAERLLGSLRSGDTVARMGGDEFAVLIEDTVEHPLVVADRVFAAFGAPFVIDGHSLPVRPSIGLARSLAGTPDVSAESLLKHADLAMYAAKRSGTCGAPLVWNRDAAVRRRRTHLDHRAGRDARQLEINVTPQKRSRRHSCLSAPSRTESPAAALRGPRCLTRSRVVDATATVINKLRYGAGHGALWRCGAVEFDAQGDGSRYLRRMKASYHPDRHRSERPEGASLVLLQTR